MKVLVSACLLGENCKYNGGNNYNEKAVRFLEGKEVLPVCPELLAGLGSPRTPIELLDGVLVDQNGNSVDACLRRAVEALLEKLDLSQIECAVLKSRSPTCGPRQIYDGTFTGRLTDGAGVFAQALMDAGCRVVDVEEL